MIKHSMSFPDSPNYQLPQFTPSPGFLQSCYSLRGKRIEQSYDSYEPSTWGDAPYYKSLPNAKDILGINTTSCI